MRRLLARVLLAATALTVLGAGSAQAATVTIGSSLTGTFNGFTSSIVHTEANLAVEPPGIAASPVDGTVVSWRFIGAGPLIPRVVRPVGGGLYVGAGTGAEQSGAGSMQLSGPFAISLPIKAGDLFGFNAPPGAGFVARFTDTLATRHVEFEPPLPDGGPAETPDFTPDLELGIQALVRYCLVPNLKRKKPGAARQALAAADCTVGTVKKSKKKKRKKKKVLRQSVAPGTSISDTQPIDLTVSKKTKKKR